jgi:ABC-2 type transport system ATP-binding protein
MAAQYSFVMKGLSKAFPGQKPILNNIHLQFYPDAKIGIVGPNGSGKSTLIRAWIGFERATEGRLLTGGIDPQRDRGGAVARVGYVPQSPSLYRDLTVAQHITLAGTLRDGFDEAMAARYVERLSIPLRSRAGELSGGEGAQVGLALALATRAPILLLDEPLASLDPLARREFLHLMVEAVRAAGATALLSSHVITDIEQACDRLIVLGKGHTLLDLPIAEAIAHHRIVDGAAAEAARVAPAEALIGTFPAPSGEPLSLVRVPALVPVGTEPIGREATLEEIVIGHLAAGRRRAADAARQAEGVAA